MPPWQRADAQLRPAARLADNALVALLAVVGGRAGRFVLTQVPGPASGPLADFEHVGRSPLPTRYGDPWVDAFVAKAAPDLRPGARVLDVGSGARPAIAPDQRPPGCVYVGLDVSADELHRAAPGAYDDLIVGDICARLPSTEGRFDLVVSWQVLEHVPSMSAALATQRAALVPGGRMVAMLSGAWSVQALAARVVPYRASTWLQARLLGSVPEDKFPTRYDGCTARSLRSILQAGGWTSWEVEPHYRSGGYFAFSRSLQRLYLVYESWTARGPKVNLATHYIVHAVA